METTGHTPPATQSDAASSTPTAVEPVVQTLILKYRNIEVLHPLLQTVFESPSQKKLLTSVIQQDYNRLTTRSQKLADHEVNMYEKAFCMLMENEDDRIGGLEIYVEKILGVGDLEDCASDEDKEKWLLKGVAVRALLEQVSSSVSVSVSPPETSPTAKPTQQQQQPEHQQQQPALKATTPSNPNPNPNPQPNPQRPSILTTKLLPLYHAAKADFHALPALTRTSTPHHVADKTKAAKFLRDTVENCIQYLTTATTAKRGAVGAGARNASGGERQGGDEGLMMELQGTLKVAKEVAEVGSGGRKRRFDLVGGGGQWGWGEKRGGGLGWGRDGGRGGARGGRGGMRGGFY